MDRVNYMRVVSRGGVGYATILLALAYTDYTCRRSMCIVLQPAFPNYNAYIK